MQMTWSSVDGIALSIVLSTGTRGSVVEAQMP